MKKLTVFLMAMEMVSSCSHKMSDDLVWVKGGAFVNTKSTFYGKGAALSDFYIGKYEVTQKEWRETMGTDPSVFKGDSLPVESVNWYDCVEYCNKKSLQKGLQPYYHIDKNKKDAIDAIDRDKKDPIERDKKDPENSNDLDDIKWAVTINPDADGYRLPTEAEWEYAAGGGQKSRSFTYSGSNKAAEVAWYWQNAGDKYLTGDWSWPGLVKNHNRTKAVGSKSPNELGLYDMSGNVREWCWDLHPGNATDDPPGRIWKGGGWIGADFCCASSFRAPHEANGKGPDQGFRICRNDPNSGH